MDAATAAKFDAVLSELHDVRRLLHRLVQPIDVLTTAEVAQRLRCDERTVKRLYARGVFTDARPPGKRVKSSPRRTYADEVTVYQTEGVAGVRRLRDQLGR